jgi:hypothetical protein
MPDADGCKGAIPDCTTCHTSTWPAEWNAYGAALYGTIQPPFEAGLKDAIAALAEADSDGDGVTNAEELRSGTNPGDADEAFPLCRLTDESGGGFATLPESYDLTRAFRRVSLLYCGQSPTYDALKEFAALDREAGYARLHQHLQACLDGEYWRDEGLPRVADPLVRPVYVVGKDSPSGIVIGDYEWDYRLFVYLMTDDRDIRDLLLADYHIEEGPDGELRKVEGAFGGLPGQPLEPEHRAGLITTQWYFALNTMFSAMPRTAAAQAYRAFLGLDLSREQGVYPIPGEPTDVDDTGVDAPACAICHSTLDPLSYAFAYYEGIRGGMTGTYLPDRPSSRISQWSEPKTYLFGKEVKDVREWAEEAVKTDAFRRTFVTRLAEHAVDRPLLPDERHEIETIWRQLPDLGWSANRTIHRIVDTYTFGGR